MIRYAPVPVLLVLLCRSLAPAAAQALPLPGPASWGPRSTDQAPREAAAQNARCEGCHARIAAQWRASFHRRSYTDGAVQQALRIDPRPFCRACHAPEADPRTPAGGWAAGHGVACVTCHLIRGRIVTGPGPAGPAGAAPHEVVRDPGWRGGGACARCHEFAFPDGYARVRPESMQLTVSEHESSPLRDRECVDCHMPLAGGRRSHRFAGGHDPGLLRRALSVRATRPGPTEVVLELSPAGVGHAFPTGDLFRRIEVRVEARLPGGRRVTEARYLMRHLAMERQVPGTFTQVTRSDDRLFGPTALRFSLPEAEGRRVEWALTYQRVTLPGAAPPESVPGRMIDGSVVLARGWLPAAPSR